MLRFVLVALSVLTTLIVLWMLAALALGWLVPTIGQWHMAHCLHSTSFVCSASANFLRYWWLALLPLLGIATWLLTRPRKSSE